MENEYNIYNKIESLEKDVLYLKGKVEQYESQHQLDLKKKDDDDGLAGFYTFNDMLLKFKISRQCLFNYRKHVPLKKSSKIGRYDRFKKKEVHRFMQKVVELKESTPELFTYKVMKLVRTP